MNFKYEPNTNPKHNFPVNQPPHLNFLECDAKKYAQNTSPKSDLFKTCKGVRGFECCTRIGLTDEQLTLNLDRP